MSNNWLIKLCSEQPTNEAELEQALGELDYDQLMSLNEAPTPGLDEIQEKMAFAEQLGKEMAIENPRIMAQAENEALVESLSDEDAVKLAMDLGLIEKEAAPLSSLSKKVLIGAGVAGAGAAGAAAGHSKGNKKGLNTGRKQGYQVGAQQGYTAGARRGYTAGAQRGYQIGRSHAQRSSGGKEKKAFLGGIAAKATKMMAGSKGKALTGMVAKNPNAALAVGGAAAGAAHSKATGGSALSGAALGAGMGYGAGRLGAGKHVQKGVGKLYANARKAAPGMSVGKARRMGLSGPVQSHNKFASSNKEASKLSVLGKGGKMAPMRSAYARPTMEKMIAQRGGKGARKLPGMTNARKGPPPIPKHAAEEAVQAIKVAGAQLAARDFI